MKTYEINLIKSDNSKWAVWWRRKSWFVSMKDFIQDAIDDAKKDDFLIKSIKRID